MATAATGLVGVGFATVPFLSSLKPSARARALGAPVEVPLGSLEPGEMIRVVWRGKLVYVLRRTSDMLKRLSDVADLERPDSLEADIQPDYTVNEHRSLNPEYLVVGSCTHLGCAPLPQFDYTFIRLVWWIFARAMAQNSIFLVAFIKACPHQQT